VTELNFGPRVTACPPNWGLWSAADTTLLTKITPSGSLYYCLFAPHIYGVVFRAHSVLGELRIQRNANREVATIRWSVHCT